MRKFLLSLTMLMAGAMAVWAQVADGVYTINNEYNGRGTLCYGTYSDNEYLGLTNITLNGYTGNNVAVADEDKADMHWYVKTVNGGTYFYNIGKGLFLQERSVENATCAESPSNGFTFEEREKNGTNYLSVKNGNYYLTYSCGWKPNQGQVRWINNSEEAATLLTFTLVPGGSTTYATEIEAVEKILKNVGEISYTLTDAAGNVFEGTYEGIRGKDLPQLTGAHGYSLNDVEWNNEGNEFTATITFPVIVSSDDVTNATLLNIVNNTKFIRAVGTNVKVQTTDVSPLDMGAFWAIYPALENGEFTFTIKNLSTEMYIYTEATSSKHNTEGTVILNKTATKLAIVTDNDFKVDGKTLYLSINSSGDTNVWLGVYGNAHTGTNISTKAPSTETITLADDQPYAWPIEVDGEFDVQYTRTLIPGIWNPLYLPFEAGLNLNDYDVAEFTSAEGNTVVLTKLTADNEEGDVCLKANKAYVVRAKRDEVLTLDLGVGGAISSNVEVEQELGEDFSVKGNYAVRTGADLEATDRVVGSNGNWGKLKGASTLKPYRLILSVPENFDASQALTMRVLDETTGVEEIIVDRDQQAVIFDLMGRRVETITEGGIYIVNGKKVVR